MATRPLKILMVGAHPSDAFDQAGGTLAHHAACGDHVTTVTLTTGVRSHHWELIEQKREQQEELDIEQKTEQAAQEKLDQLRGACRILGLEDVRAMGFEDDDILLTRDMVEAIADMIRDVRPDVLITHHPYEGAGFKMHATTSQATIYAFQQAMGTGRGKKKSHYVPAIFFMNPMAYMGHNTLAYASTSQIDYIVDITDVIDKKVKAMDLITSQYYNGAYARKCHEVCDGRTGGFGGVAYGEAFQSFFPRTCYRLPVSDAVLRAQVEPNHEGMARRSEMVAALMPLPAGCEITDKFRMPKELYDV